MFASLKKESRLGQWTGRRRSSRSEVPVWMSLCQWSAMSRLGTVLATMLLVTIIGYTGNWPLPYCVGDAPRTDLRVRIGFEVVNQPQTELAREEALQRLPADLAANTEAREAARAGVPMVVERYPAGTPLVSRGQPISPSQLMLLHAEHRAFLQTLTFGDHFRRAAALFLVMSLLAAVVVLYVSRFQPTLAQSHTKIAMVCGLVVGAFWIALLLNKPPWHAVLVPLTVTAMVFAIVYNPQFSLLMSFSLALAVTVSLGMELDHLLIQMAGLATAVLLLQHVRSRTWLVRVGLGAGMAFFAMTIATSLLSGQDAQHLLFQAFRHFIWGSLAGFLLTGSLPVVERCFGIVTDVSLLELADSSHPLLQELIRRAPGTYTHSMTVATMAEAAAEAINANAALARVGSYFHDVGKMLKPEYFIENQTGENRHDALEPALSRLIIIGHVKDGMALARQYGLPRPIIDFIQQHHGTTLVEYFYWEAVRMQEGAGNDSAELEAEFRYPGPKPQTRENGIVMLADAVESTSRTLKDPSPGSIRKLVHDLLMKRLLDGQFEESGLTLTELHAIEESLCKGLIALFHARIHYPEEASTSESRRAS